MLRNRDSIDVSCREPKVPSEELLFTPSDHLWELNFLDGHLVAECQLVAQKQLVEDKNHPSSTAMIFVVHFEKTLLKIMTIAMKNMKVGNVMR